MSSDQSIPPQDREEPEWDGRDRLLPRARHEFWTITFPFFAHDEHHAHTVAQHASRRLAKVLPWFDQHAIAMARESDPYQVIPVYCDDDIYCALKPLHDGPCRAQNGANLDLLDTTRDGVPEFGAEI